MSFDDWKSFLAHELRAALQTRLISVILVWLLMALILTMGACLWWIWPHVGVLLIYWPMAVCAGVVVGVLGIIPIFLLRRILNRPVYTH